MRNRIIQNLAAGIVLLSPLAISNAQQLPAGAATTINGRAPIAATAPTAVPALVPYSGTAIDTKGQPLTGETDATFLIYKDQTGGEPLFTETQTIAFDQAGHYKVQLGASNPNGLPSDLFATGEARWLEVQIAGQQPEPRVLLASVPYALKAADAATLGGLPASAYALAGTTAANLSPATITPNASGTTVTTTGGTANTIAKFSGTSTIVNSLIYDNGTEVGIGTTSPFATLTVDGTLAANGNETVYGTLQLSPTGTATASKAYDSHAFNLASSAYNSSTKAVVNPRFYWQTEPTGNDTASPSATLNLLSSATSAAPTETGLHFGLNGIITFASGQTFPGTGTGNGTITAVTAGTDLTGGGASGNVTLKLDTTKVPTLAGNNTYTGSNVFVPSLYEDTDVNIDNTNSNPGNISPGLRFGSASGEGMSSKRTAGGNQYGLDFYTGYSPRMSINASGQVAIGTGATFNGAQLQVRAASGIGVYGQSNDTNISDDVAGVYGYSTTGLPGVEGRNYQTGSGTNYNAAASGPGILGVAGQAYYGGFGPGYPIGVLGASYRYDGVAGSSGLEPGVIGSSDEYYGIVGEAGTSASAAGYFFGDIGVTGDVSLTGTLTAGAKDFKIDHPGDPANKYLVHASVESSEMMNIYTGNVTTDELGLATIVLPSWFEQLNADFRYQLTTIGRDAHAWIAQKVHDGKFQIATNATNVEVSWQITAVRQDPFAKAHPLVVEQQKPERERGFYLHPELYGQPEEKQVEWGKYPQQTAERKARREARKSRATAARSTAGETPLAAHRQTAGPSSAMAASATP